MAATIYMKYPGVPGAVKAKGHQGWIEIESFHWGALGPGQSSGRGSDREPSRPTYSDVAVTKVQDSASPQLFRESLKGEGKEVVVDFMAKAAEGGEAPKPHLSVTLSNALISNYQISGAGGSSTRPHESLTLNFSGVAFTYNATGEDPSSQLWNLGAGP